jgi:Helix-turn-helix domain of resolvase
MPSCRRRSTTRLPRQIGWVISVEDWALIRRLVADGVPQRQVARGLGIGRSTVERALASDRPPKYARPVVPTWFTPFEPLVRQLLAATPDMPATVIAERVGWTGDAAQCDLWFPPRQIPLEDGSTALLPVLVITAAHTQGAPGPPRVGSGRRVRMDRTRAVPTTGHPLAVAVFPVDQVREDTIDRSQGKRCGSPSKAVGS